jgi:hypothetical protein
MQPEAVEVDAGTGEEVASGEIVKADLMSTK